MVNLLEIEDLFVKVEGKEVLKGLSLQIANHEVHAIMGPNGSGKSTLAHVLAGHPSYEVTRGKVWFRGEDLLAKEPEERAHLGLFMSFQYPLEIAGVSNRHFLFSSFNALKKAREEEPISEEAFEILLDEKMHEMGISLEFKERGVNEGFSGGEKKRNEILQMLLLEPTLSLLDETDSGLDIDAMRVVAEGINKMRGEKRAILLITHYQRLLSYVVPDFVHVLYQGKIVRSAGKELALELEEKGYQP